MSRLERRVEADRDAPIADYGALAGAGIRSWPRRAMRRRAGVEDPAAE
jgi:hypothetical protein